MKGIPWFRLSEPFLSEELRDLDTEDGRKAHQIVFAFWLLFCAGHLLGLSSFLRGNKLLMLPYFFIFCVLFLFALRFIRSLRLIGHLLSFSLVIFSLVWTLYSGGLQATKISMWPVIPFLAIFLSGRKAGFFWLGIVFTCIGALHGFDLVGLSFPTREFRGGRPVLVGAFFLTLVFFIIALAYERSSNQMLKKMKKRADESRALLNSLPDHIFRVNSDGLCLQCQLGISWPFSVSANDMRNLSLETLSPFYSNLLQKLLQDTLVLKKLHRSELSFPLDGKVHYGEVCCSPINEKEVLFVLEDITERKEIGLKLQRTNETLVQMAHLKNQFVSNVSHELWTPLTSIVGSLRLLIHAEKKIASEQKKPMLELAERNAVRLSELVSELLDFQKIESDGLQAECEPLEPIKTGTTFLALHKKQADLKRIQLVFEADGALALVYADYRILRQIFSNLLSNAIKFSSEGSSIYIRARKEEEWIVFAFIDEGQGISEEHISQIFDGFFRAENTAHENVGVGLGLAVTKELIRVLNGTIDVASELNKGSTFTVKLPIAKTKSFLLLKDK